jgi:hypothetical protein
LKTSRLPKTKNMGRSMSAFSSVSKKWPYEILSIENLRKTWPSLKVIVTFLSNILQPIRSIGSGKKRDVPVKNAVVVEKASCKVDTNSSNSKLVK